MKTNRGMALIELLVYMSVLLVLMGVGYAAFYRCLDNTTALRQSSDDIVNALHAGEDWRGDVRKAARVRLDSTPAEQILHLFGPHGEVDYRFAANAVSRRIGDNPWSPFLSRVQSTAFVSDSRRDVTAWRWELELQPHKKRISRIRPLFTFIAVPAGDSSK